MPMYDDSSIDDITDALEQIKRKRAFLRCLQADKDAGEIAGCSQMLKQCIDNFLVGDLLVVRCPSAPERSQQVETTMMIEVRVEASLTSWLSWRVY